MWLNSLEVKFERVFALIKTCVIYDFKIKNILIWLSDLILVVYSPINLKSFDTSVLYPERFRNSVGIVNDSG